MTETFYWVAPCLILAFVVFALLGKYEVALGLIIVLILWCFAVLGVSAVRSFFHTKATTGERKHEKEEEEEKPKPVRRRSWLNQQLKLIADDVNLGIEELLSTEEAHLKHSLEEIKTHYGYPSKLLFMKSGYPKYVDLSIALGCAIHKYKSMLDFRGIDAPAGYFGVRPFLPDDFGRETWNVIFKEKSLAFAGLHQKEATRVILGFRSRRGLVKAFKWEEQGKQHSIVPLEWYKDRDGWFLATLPHKIVVPPKHTLSIHLFPETTGTDRFKILGVTFADKQYDETKVLYL